jgi:hypothetical protein
MKRYSKLGEYVEWHECQFNDALRIADEKFAERLTLIPGPGFYVMAYRAVQKVRQGDDYLRSGIAIMKDIDDVTYPKVVTSMGVALVGKREPLGALGTDSNPFHEHFERTVDELPERWESYLKWRRRQPRKPVPEWLVQLRRTGRTRRVDSPTAPSRVGGPHGASSPAVSAS